MKKLLSIIAMILLPALVSAQVVTFPNRGGTGTSTSPSTDQVLIGIGNNAYGLKTIKAGSNITIATTSSQLTISGAALAGDGVSNWLYDGNRLTPSTTVGIGVFASSTISHISSTYSTSTNSLIGTLSLTNDLTVANGGTGASTLTGLLQGNGTSAFTAISDSSTGGQILRVTGASTYAWGALDLADTDAVTGTLAVGNGGTGITSLGAGVATWLGTPSASNLRSAVSGTTGTAGNLVFSGSPTITGTLTADLVTLNYASTTGISGTNLNFTNATGTTLRGFGLFDCDAASNAVTWDVTNGKFGCNTITATGDGVSNWLYNGSRLSPSTTVGIGVFASSTIGGGNGANGLTINGAATTTGNHLIQGSATSTNFFAALGTFTNAVINTLLTVVNATVTGILTIPNGTGGTADDPGEIYHDTSDNQLIIDDQVIATKEPLFKFGHGSTSPFFATSTVNYFPIIEDGYTVTDLNCMAVGGGTKPVTMYGETLTCDSDGTLDDGSIAIPTIGAGSTTVTYTMGAGAGVVNAILITVTTKPIRE